MGTRREGWYNRKRKNFTICKLAKSRVIVLLFIIAMTVVLLLLYSVYRKQFQEEKCRNLLLWNEELFIAKKRKKRPI
jgi:hypothetical protein